jgi:hypothetical protein
MQHSFKVGLQLDLEIAETCQLPVTTYTSIHSKRQSGHLRRRASSIVLYPLRKVGWQAWWSGGAMA